MWNESLKLVLGRAANQAIFTCVEFRNSNKRIKLLNKDNFRPGNRKSPLNKLFEQFVKQRRHFLPDQCQKNQWDCTFFKTVIWKIAIEAEAYFCKRRVRKILKRGSRTEFENGQPRRALGPPPNQESGRHIQLFRERLSEKVCTRQSRKVIWDVINTSCSWHCSCRT